MFAIHSLGEYYLWVTIKTIPTGHLPKGNTRPEFIRMEEDMKEIKEQEKQEYEFLRLALIRLVRPEIRGNTKYLPTK